ncbi:EP300-interacting inhibitor of differentiation 2-like [Hippopotamus amphibius kiboko]|uniref:EP300-interacting inhibitor of differentiation 2-like n=1 Tax=Hippopotamus amphibius kiboko TaxID=575201 RepID=UPI00259AA604|nr:EP300-interacting inhibitor of differentiation 2-like [Hippopotamus amphibius kiboko]
MQHTARLRPQTIWGKFQVCRHFPPLGGTWKLAGARGGRMRRARFVRAAELTPRSEMSELPADSSVPPAGAANDHGDVPQAEPVEASDRATAAAREGPMAAPREGPVAAAREARVAAVAGVLAEPAEGEGAEARPRPRPGNGPGAAAAPYRLLPQHFEAMRVYQQGLRRYLERFALAPGGIPELEGHRRGFVGPWGAREAAFDAEYRRDPQRMDADMLTLSITLTASAVINPLIRELGCDKCISRE